MPGTQFLRPDGNSRPECMLTTPDGKPGLKADYSELQVAVAALVADRTRRCSPLAPNQRQPDDANLADRNGRQKEHRRSLDRIHDRTETGDYLLGVRGDGFGRLWSMVSKLPCSAEAGESDAARSAAPTSKRA